MSVCVMFSFVLLNLVAASSLNPVRLKEQQSFVIGTSDASDFTHTLVLGAPVSLNVDDSYRKYSYLSSS